MIIVVKHQAQATYAYYITCDDGFTCDQSLWAPCFSYGCFWQGADMAHLELSCL